jgi:hypothetical protein
VLGVTEAPTHSGKIARKVRAAIVEKIPRRGSPQPSEQHQPRRRSVYDYEGEYEFISGRHWSAPSAERADVKVELPKPKAEPTISGQFARPR